MNLNINRLNSYGKVLINEDGSYYSNMKLGGKIKCVLYPKSNYTLKKAYSYFVTQQIPFYILGSGTNSFTMGFNGVLIKLNEIKKKKRITKNKFTLSTNHTLSEAIVFLEQRNITTLSPLLGLPGTIGGALYSNASFLGNEISKYLISVKVINQNGKTKVINKDDLFFSYRSSLFKNLNVIILEATFKCISEKIERNNYRQLTQPKGYSLGSIYQNDNNYYAGVLIEALGLKGYNYKGIRISLKHSNIWLNEGGNEKSLWELMFIVELLVYFQFQIRLKREIVVF